MKDLKHQTEYLVWADGRNYDANFSDPGTGKTRMFLRRAALAHEAGLIDVAIVLAPNSVKTNWVAWDHMLEPGEMDEVTKHLRDVVRGVWVSGATGKDKKAWAKFECEIDRSNHLVILAVNYEALLSEQLYAWLTALCKKRRVMLGADESTRIGKPGSQRTKRATKLARLCSLVCAMTGTPILKSPLKIYSQAKFLSPEALGFKSFYAFRNRYCIMGGFEGRQVVDYQRMDELSDKIAQFSYRVRLEDCVQMPSRGWKKHTVYMEPEQARAYRSMREEFFALIGTTEITAQIVLAQMTRLQQITGGYLAKDGEVFELVPPERNPKVKEAFEIIEGAPRQCIVWCRFRPELDAMARFLAKEGVSFLEFHGDLDAKEKLTVRNTFKRGEKRVLLGTTSSGGIGIDEFKVASDAIFFSNDFDTERRNQAEGRSWRIGTTESVRYHDILVPNTVDMKIIRVLREDAKLSGKLLRGEWRGWL